MEELWFVVGEREGGRVGDCRCLYILLGIDMVDCKCRVDCSGARSSTTISSSGASGGTCAWYFSTCTRFPVSSSPVGPLVQGGRFAKDVVRAKDYRAELRKSREGSGRGNQVRVTEKMVQAHEGLVLIQGESEESVTSTRSVGEPRWSW